MNTTVEHVVAEFSPVGVFARAAAILARGGRSPKFEDAPSPVQYYERDDGPNH